MIRPKPVMKMTRAWIMSQKPGTCLTPTGASLAMGRDGLTASSGATSMVLQALTREGRATRVGPMPPLAPRGGYKLLAPILAPVVKAIIRPLIPSAAVDAPKAVLQALDAIQEIITGMEKLQAAILLPYTSRKAHTA